MILYTGVSTRTPQITFITRVDPVSAPPPLTLTRINDNLEAATAARGSFRVKLKMVELPGTAPGSTIAYSVTTFSVITGKPVPSL